jgi:hypothetical protein
LRGHVAALGLQGAARSLGTSVVTLERAADPYALLPEITIRRLDAAIDRLCAAALPVAGWSRALDDVTPT